MKSSLKFIGEVVVGFGFLFGLHRENIISLETAITIGTLSFLFILCFEEVRRDLEPVRNALAEMQKYLGTRWKFVPLHEINPTGFVQQNSPIQLTPLGKSFLEESGSKEVVDKKYSEWEKEIDEINCKTALDVENKTSSIIALNEGEPFMKKIKDFVYQNPKFNGTQLSFADAQRVMVVYLRDMYLSKHPQILPDKE